MGGQGGECVWQLKAEQPYPHVDKSLVEQQHSLVTGALLQATVLCLTVELEY